MIDGTRTRLLGISIMQLSGVSIHGAKTRCPSVAALLPDIALSMTVILIDTELISPCPTLLNGECQARSIHLVSHWV